MALSLVLQAFQRQANAGQSRGALVPQASRSPTLQGVARGTMGVTGSRPFTARNVNAGIDKDRKKLAESAVMQAFLRRSRARLI